MLTRLPRDGAASVASERPRAESESTDGLPSQESGQRSIERQFIFFARWQRQRWTPVFTVHISHFINNFLMIENAYAKRVRTDFSCLATRGWGCPVCGYRMGVALPVELER